MTTSMENNGALPGLLGPKESFCVAHSVWKGLHRQFVMHPVVQNATRVGRPKLLSAVDALRVPCVKMNVRGGAYSDRSRTSGGRRRDTPAALYLSHLDIRPIPRVS
jgi:hypothetical protein